MPQVDLQKVLARLAGGKPVAGILLYGDDAYLREVTRKALVEAVVPEGAREWGVSRFSLRDDELGRVLQQAQTLPMLAPRQVVFVEQLEELERLEEKAREKAVKAIEAYLEDAAPFTLLVFEAIKLDDRMRLSKMLGEKVMVVEAAVPAEGPARTAMVADLVTKMAGELGVVLEGEAASDLADLVNGELARARTELEKLASYVGERRRITPADVDLLVVSEKKYSIWELADMLASRQRDRALEFLSSVLREGEGPPAIVGALAWMYRKLIHAQDLPRGASKWDAMRQLGMREKAAQTALAQARRIPRAQLLAGLRALYDADSRLKSGTAEPGAVLEFLVGQLTAPPVQSGAGAAASR
jgi:DNA polymerase-3 subunit delta